ncbi:MAG: type II toxin-antitoxin system HicB family antitoxin [Spirochaetaceae bacterium]|nr:MAG: type II toxin-antitoxin system HicB family antitoxin [Spirochaetaceae bacterium]
MIQTFTALIQREDDMFVALCTDLDIASQGASIAEARENLKEAVELFLEEASEAEIAEPIHTEQYISSIEVAVAEA